LAATTSAGIKEFQFQVHDQYEQITLCHQMDPIQKNEGRSLIIDTNATPQNMDAAPQTRIAQTNAHHAKQVVLCGCEKQPRARCTAAKKHRQGLAYCEFLPSQRMYNDNVQRAVQKAPQKVPTGHSVYEEVLTTKHQKCTPLYKHHLENTPPACRASSSLRLKLLLCGKVWWFR
jgi:hypothetical protein